MGKLIKNHWARLIILTAAAYQLAASVHCLFWPKIFWDYTTQAFNPLIGQVRERHKTIHSYHGFPYLQVFSILCSMFTFCLEAPIPQLAGTRLQRSILARVCIYPIHMFACILIFQGTNASFYYLLGTMGYIWAFASGEAICAVPWTLPQKSTGREVPIEGEPKQVAAISV